MRLKALRVVLGVCGCALMLPGGVTARAQLTFVGATGWDGTALDMGAHAVGSVGTPLVLTFQMAAGTVTGAVVARNSSTLKARDFTATGTTCAERTVSKATTCTVTLTFAPQVPGDRLGAMVIYTHGGLPTPMVTMFLTGVGLGPQLVFPGGPSVFVNTPPAKFTLVQDGAGNLFEGFGSVVMKAISAGSYYPEQLTIATGLNNAVVYATDKRGNVYLTVREGSDDSVMDVLKLPWDGKEYGTPLVVGAGFSQIRGMTVDGGGNVFLDSVQLGGGTTNRNDGIFRILWNGQAYAAPTLFANGLSLPSGMATDPGRNIYVSDHGNGRVLEYPAGSSVPVVVEVGEKGSPSSVYIGDEGDVYLEDYRGVNRLERSMPPKLNFAKTPPGKKSSTGVVIERVLNIGNQPLSLTGVSYAADFPDESTAASACTSGLSLRRGRSCTLAIAFVPGQTGNPLSESLVLTDDSLNVQSSQSVGLTGVSKKSQTIELTAIGTPKYGAAAIALTPTASSGLPVTLSVVRGPAVLTPTANGYSLQITGVGSVQLVARQAGNTEYDAAVPVSQSFSVAKAALTVTAGQLTMKQGAAVLPLTYTMTGFQNGETQGQVVYGQPVLSTSVTAKTAPGVYAIHVAAGSLVAQNYSFLLVPGTLTVTQ